MTELMRCLDLLRQLVAIPSTSQNEEAHARFLEGLLREELGMETTLQHVSGKSYNVIGRWRRDGGSAGRKLILGGHLDTVPPTERWTTDPYRLTEEGDKLRGLGAGDMKGGLAAQLTVLRRLKEERAALDADVEFVGLADEERHSIGANAYVASMRRGEESAQRVFFIMAEPHYDNIVIGAAGKVLLRLETTGRAGHAATPEKGINAIDCMAALLAGVNEIWGTRYQRGECGSHCCLKIESRYPGYSLNIPEQCSCLINKQLLPWERAEEFIEQVEKLYREKVGGGGLRIVREIPSYPSYRLTADQEDVAELTKFLKARFGHEPELRINQSVSDGNILYNSLKIPTVLFGPQGVAFHTEGEYLRRSTLEPYMEELYAYIKSVYGTRHAEN